MQVAHAYAVLGEVICKIFRHALGECGHQHPFATVNPQIYFGQQIINLGRGRAHDDLRINQASGAYDLLDHLCLMLLFILRRSGGYEDGLRHHRLELVEP